LRETVAITNGAAPKNIFEWEKKFHNGDESRKGTGKDDGKQGRTRNPSERGKTNSHGGQKTTLSEERGSGMRLFGVGTQTAVEKNR